VVSQIAGVRPKAPFVNAPIGTKRESAKWHFETAPSAKRPLIFALRQCGAFGGAPRHCSQLTHAGKWPMCGTTFNRITGAGLFSFEQRRHETGHKPVLSWKLSRAA
jgi:hypothetical protein